MNLPVRYPSTLKSNLGQKSQSQIVLGQIRTFVFGVDLTWIYVRKTVNAD